MGLIVGAAILITVAGIVAMVAVNQANKRRHETETLLFELEANAQGLNANEWEAIASQKIDPDKSEKLTFGFRDISVPWSDDHIDGLDCLGAKS